MPWLPIAAAAAGAIAGGVAGATDDVSTSKSKSWTDLPSMSEFEKLIFGTTAGTKKLTRVKNPKWDEAIAFYNNAAPNLKRLMGPTAEDYAKSGGIAEYIDKESTESETTPGALSTGFQDFLKMINAGPGQGDVEAANNSSRSFAAMLDEYSRTGGLPSAADLNTGRSYATSIFAPRREALAQQFTDQETAYGRLAGRLGRDVSDPILQAKMRTEQARQAYMLDAEQNAAGTEAAYALPGQRINYAGMKNELLGGLAAQAFRNRAAILEMGSQLGGAERNWRVTTGVNNSNSTNVNEGSIGKGLAGALAGAGQGLSIGGGISSMFAGGGMPTSPKTIQPSGWGPTAPGSSTGIGSLGPSYIPHPAPPRTVTPSRTFESFASIAGGQRYI